MVQRIVESQHATRHLAAFGRPRIGCFGSCTRATQGSPCPRDATRLTHGTVFVRETTSTHARITGALPTSARTFSMPTNPLVVHWPAGTQRPYSTTSTAVSSGVARYSTLPRSIASSRSRACVEQTNGRSDTLSFIQFDHHERLQYGRGRDAPQSQPGATLLGYAVGTVRTHRQRGYLRRISVRLPKSAPPRELASHPPSVAGQLAGLHRYTPTGVTTHARHTFPCTRARAGQTLAGP